MKLLIITYIILHILSIILTPFCFGKERKPYTPGDWLSSLIISAPLLYLLFRMLENY